MASVEVEFWKLAPENEQKNVALRPQKVPVSADMWTHLCFLLKIQSRPLTSMSDVMQGFFFCYLDSLLGDKLLKTGIICWYYMHKFKGCFRVFFMLKFNNIWGLFCLIECSYTGLKTPEILKIQPKYSTEVSFGFHEKAQGHNSWILSELTQTSPWIKHLTYWSVVLLLLNIVFSLILVNNSNILTSNTFSRH